MAPPQPPPPQHPDVVVRLLQALAAPMKLSDGASRLAGNHMALEEVDDGIKDVLAVVSTSLQS